MMKFVTRRPGISAAIVLVCACAAFGAPRVGSFIGSNGASIVRGAWAFGSALVSSAF